MGQRDDIRQKMVVIKRINRCCDERRESESASGLEADGHTGLRLLRSTSEHHTAASEQEVTDNTLHP